MAKTRPQQHRISWPLTADQVENIDTMFETLFRQLRNTNALASTASTTATSVSTRSLIAGPQGDPGPTGDAGEQPKALLALCRYFHDRLTIIEAALNITYGPNDLIVPDELVLLETE